MLRHGGRVIARGLDQFPAAQQLQCGLDGALGEAGCFREGAQAGGDRFPSRARGQAVEINVNEIRRWFLIVPDDVAHENVEDVIVDGDGFAEPRHQKVTSDM